MNRTNRSPLDETMMNMTWIEVEEVAKSSNLVLLPMGTIEAHGPHLPLGSDTYGALQLARICRRLLAKRGVSSIIAPPFILGITNVLSNFAGTFRVRKTTVIECLKDFFVSLKEHGFTRQVIINHHLEKEHINTVFEAMEVIGQQGGGSIYLLGDKDIVDRLEPGANLDRLILSSWTMRESGLLRNYNDFHAGEKETSFMLRFFPRLVRAGWEKLGPCFPELSAFRSGGVATRKVAPLAYFGDPSVADAKKGEIIYRKTAEGYVDALMRKFFDDPNSR